MLVLIAVGFIAVIVMLAGIWIALMTRLNYKLYTEWAKQEMMKGRGK